MVPLKRRLRKLTVVVLLTLVPLPHVLAAEAVTIPAIPPVATADRNQLKLPNDKLTVGEAKSFLVSHAEEKRLLEVDRQAMLAKAAKLTPQQRLKLVNDFVAETSIRRKKIESDMPRAAELDFKVRQIEKPNVDKAKSTSTGK